MRSGTVLILVAAGMVGGCASTSTTTEGQGTNKVDVAQARVDEASVLEISQAIKGGKIANSRNLMTAQPTGDALNITLPADAIVKACTGNPLAAGVPLTLALPKTAYVQEDVRVFMTNQLNARNLRVSKNSTVKITQTNEGASTDLSGNVSSRLKDDAAEEKTVIKVITNTPDIGAIAVPAKNVYPNEAAAIAQAQAMQADQNGVYVIKVGTIDKTTGHEKEAYLNVPQRLLSIFR